MNAESIAARPATRVGHLRAYVIGLLLAVFLTLIPFRAVMHGDVGRDVAFWTIVVCAAVQIVVHLVFFLHLNRRPAQHWYRVSIAFTVFVIAVLIVGSVWIMTHLNHNMMAMPAVMN